MINQIPLQSPEADLEAIRASRKPVLVYGAGWAAALAREFLESNGISTADLVVDILGAIHPELQKYNLNPITPDDVGTKYSEVVVVCGFYTRNICFDFQKKIDHLTTLGVKVVAYAFDLHLMMYPERRYTVEFVQSNMTAFESLAKKLHDDLSRKTLMAFIEQRVGGKYGPIEPLAVPDQYFTDTVYRLHDREVFVDCGAYDGDTLRDFTRALKDHNGSETFRKIYAFEPNEEPFATLLRNYGSSDSVICIRKGVWNEKATLRFSSDRLRSSKLSDSGDVSIEVDRMDDMIPYAEPTLMKMDLEGSELAALEGGRDLINKHAPKIAVCVYHKNNDLFLIPAFIESLDVSYNLHLRAHESKSSEIVLYCIPESNADLPPNALGWS